MKYKVTLACDVSCYTNEIEIDAMSLNDAINGAREVVDAMTYEPDWLVGTTNHRIVTLCDDDGSVVAEGISLDEEVAAVPPQAAHPDVYRSLCELIELVSDYENDAVPSEQAVIDRARAAMKAHGTAATSANERTGVGFAPKKPRVLITVSGGVADFIKDEGIEVAIFDYDDYEDKEDDDKYLVPSEFRDMLHDDVDLDLIEFVD